ncbi:MAG: hypothetical protein CMF96_12110 [Candidatus Marinimicrobia bacterium]|nr:hypothetical protein [Candidatus Neomarinimicrobiota bacterium]
MDLHNSQLVLINNIKNFIKKSEDKGIPTYGSGTFYFAPFGDSRGFGKIISNQNILKGLIINLKIFFKDIYKIAFLGRFKIVSNPDLKKYKNIIVNWATKKSFDKHGSYYDKHLNTYSDKNKNILWFLILIDKNIPKKIGKNIVLIANEKKKFNIKYLLNTIKASLKAKNLSNLLNDLSYLSLLAKFIYLNFDKFLSKKTNKILMPYEGQPFQNAIFKKAHQINKKIKTIGFLHSFPIGLPLNLIKRDGAPKKIIVSSISQSYCLRNFLGWKKKEIKILASTRLRVSSNIHMNNKIFLPITFNSQKKILDNLNNFILNSDINLANVQIRNHPSCLQSRKHLSLIKKIKKLLKGTGNKKIKKKISIFIGATGSVMEALERNVETIHICENPTLESYSKKLWKFIKIKKINDYVNKYNTYKKNQLIIFGKNVSLYKKYLQ